MSPTLPPSRCPMCDALYAELVQRWEERSFGPAKMVRYLIGVTATYLCGAKVEAHYRVRWGIGSQTDGAHWELLPIAGCRHAVARALKDTSRMRRH